jgi:hypothetical protein
MNADDEHETWQGWVPTTGRQRKVFDALQRAQEES